MHKLQMYENLRDMLEREVMEIEKRNDIDPQGLEHLYKLMTAIKVADKCIEREQGQSGRSYGSYENSNRSYGDSYGSNRSYVDRRSNESYGRSYDDSYARGRSRGNQKMIDRLNMLMEEATSENERQAIMDCMNRM